MEHLTVQANGAALHVARMGAGRPLLLLHGWPEFWLTWEPVMTRLADRFTLYAPDLRGFGDSDKPEGLFGPDQQAADMLALMDALGLAQAGIVGHDVGGALMQPLARLAPERIAGLFFFDFVYPGIGPRMAEPERLNNIWYQSFHQMEMAPALVGASRESCRLYIGHFLKAWSHRKHVFDDQLEAFTDNFLKDGNLAGGFAHYRAAHAGRIRMMKGEAPALPPIGVPTCVRWAEHDPLFPYEWTDRLGETFTNLDLAMFGDVGHFPHREDPDRAAVGDRGVLYAHRLELRKKGGTARRDKTLAVPCRCFEILAGKCGFAGQAERRNDGSNARRKRQREPGFNLTSQPYRPRNSVNSACPGLLRLLARPCRSPCAGW